MSYSRRCKGAIVASIVVLAGSTVCLASGTDDTLLAAQVSGVATGTVSNYREIQIPITGGVVVVWDESLPTGEIVTMFGVSTNGTTLSAPAQVRDDRVMLQYAQFDPLNGVPAVPADLAARTTNELYLVQFYGVPQQGMQQHIEQLGGEIYRFLAPNTHMVRLSPQALDAVSAQPYVRWVGAYHPAYKADETLNALGVGLLDSTSAWQDRYSFEVNARGDDQQQIVKAALEALGATVHFTTPQAYRMEATMSQAAVIELLNMNEINFAHPKWFATESEMEDMDVARVISGANHVETLGGFTGTGVRGESFDSGFLITHQDFSPNPTWRSATGTASHGTACYGVMFANGSGNATARGMAPDLEAGFVCRYQVTTQHGGTVTRHSLNQAATDPAGNVRIVLQTSSTGPYRTFNYDTISAEVDDYLFLYDLLSCQSQSNAGNQDSRPQAWAKNIVAVGGIKHLNTLSRTDDNWTSGGSTGPANDGRIKPDLAHFYDNSTTTYTTSTTGYGTFSGTSNATPTTCGAFALFFQMWHEGVFAGHGGGANVFDSRAKMATAKAMMVNSAFRYNWLSGGANGDLTRSRQGWGMADLAAMYDDRDVAFIVDESDLLAPNATNTYTIEVASGRPTFNVTMVYTDPQGNPAAAQHRINDLNLRVTDPAGTVYWGNNGLMAGNFSTSGGVANTLDTVENVFVQSPAAGIWTVEVIGASIVADSHPETTALDADYALVVRGGVESSGCYADCDANGILNVFDYICFGNAYAANDPYADCDGNSTFNVFDYICFGNAYAAGCP